MATVQSAIDTTTTAVTEITPVADENPVAPEPTPAAPLAGAHTYYVVVGAFTEEKNIEAAQQRLQAKYPASVILVEKAGRLTKLGYSVGSNFYRAKAELTTAQAEDASYWLLKK